jgi:hypothetical protein
MNGLSLGFFSRSRLLISDAAVVAGLGSAAHGSLLAMGAERKRAAFFAAPSPRFRSAGSHRNSERARPGLESWPELASATAFSKCNRLGFQVRADECVRRYVG